MFDLVSYPITYLAPKTYGGTDIQDLPSFPGWVKQMAPQLGVDWRILWIVLAWAYAMGTVYGFEVGAHIVALVFVGLGWNLDEDWPKVSDWWIYKPSSLNEFWGKRYHQVRYRLMLFFTCVELS